jgi:hypothetical protein
MLNPLPPVILAQISIRVKVKFTPEQAMKTQRGSTSTVLLFNPGANWAEWTAPRPGSFILREREPVHTV